ncbi:MnuA family membrane nuclease [Mycoplasma sp. 1654_15]|uniref:MnuA family membrane nuclease n=1 Tax=Mycoplasma sp. 1654_15 TaxID=2725994 RepID=UPI0014492B8D|nr:hypothetical protein [Mycoplasma sp. 1654_15]QJB71397.1 hypothetical protein HF996_02870 [Mycoplasma sp. 1654_15]
MPAYFPDGKVNSEGKLTYPKTKTTKNVDFARPPVGGKFKIKKNNQEFVLVASHFDAPGINKGGYIKGKEEGKVDSKDGFDSTNGSQEISEANHLLDTMEFFKSKTNTDNLFFMGDTNIKAKSHDKAFERLLTSYKSLIDKSNNTALGKNYGIYSNSYDKIFQSKSSSLMTENANKYPLWDVIKDNITTKQSLEDTYKEKQKEDKKPIDKTDLQNIENKVKEYISDHSPVYFEIALN